MRRVWSGEKVACLACVLVVGALAWAPGCGGAPSGGNNGAVPTGVIRVALTDAAGPYENVVIAVEEVRVVPAGGEDDDTGGGMPVVASFDTPQQYDIADLAFATEVLGEASVPAGTYNQIRLVLAENPDTGDPLNYVTLKTDPATKLPLNTPSGQQSGLKIVGKYTVEEGVINAIALDFDPERAVVEAGNSGRRNLKPTGIRVVELDEMLDTYGALAGVVAPEAAWESAVVSIIPEGGTTAIASGSVNSEDGSFRAMVPAGTYTVKVVATGYETYDSGALDPAVTFVAVVGADTDVGTITLTAEAAS